MIYSKEGILDKNFRPVDAETEKTLLDSKKLNTSSRTYFKPTDNLVIRLIPEDNYNMLREMGETNITISRWMNKTIKTSLMAFVVAFAMGVYLNHLLIIVAFALPIYLVWSKIKFIKTSYAQWRFERRVQFDKFVQLVIPYLKQTENNISVYSILGKVAPRLDNAVDRNLLMVLQREIMDKPKDIQPFLDYSRKTANTNLSDNFMSSLYDVRMGSNDLRGIYALGVTASEQLLHSIDQIVELKLKKFTFYPTKMTFVAIIPIMGFAMAYMIYTAAQLDLGSLL